MDGGGAAVGLGDVERDLLPGTQASQDGRQRLGVGGSRPVDRGDDVSRPQARLGRRAAGCHRRDADTGGLAAGSHDGLHFDAQGRTPEPSPDAVVISTTDGSTRRIVLV